jgi:ATP-dependent DNA ligase
VNARFFEPMLCLAVPKLPDGPEWQLELKLDGYRGLEISKCPFVNLPEHGRGRWGEGLTAEDMENCRWLTPRLVASIEFLEWTPENRLRHPKFVALRDDREAEQVFRED